MTRALASPLDNAALNRVSGASLAPPYGQLSVAKSMENTESSDLTHFQKSHFGNEKWERMGIFNRGKFEGFRMGG